MTRTCWRKNLQHHTLGKSTNVTTWKLEAPVKARALRVESTDPAHPLALTEVEAYGPEEAAETPAPAPAEE